MLYILKYTVLTHLPDLAMPDMNKLFLLKPANKKLAIYILIANIISSVFLEQIQKPTKWIVNFLYLQANWIQNTERKSLVHHHTAII